MWKNFSAFFFPDRFFLLFPSFFLFFPLLPTGRGGAGAGSYLTADCIWRFNRMVAQEAHKQGFVVFEREEIERRLLFKSEHYDPTKVLKFALHLENPAPNIIATSLLTLISCLRKNESSTFISAKSSSLSSIKRDDVDNVENEVENKDEKRVGSRK